MKIPFRPERKMLRDSRKWRQNCIQDASHEPGPGRRGLLCGLVVRDGSLLDVLGLDGEDGAVLVHHVVLVVVVAHKVHLGLKIEKKLN